MYRGGNINDQANIKSNLNPNDKNWINISGNYAEETKPNKQNKPRTTTSRSRQSTEKNKKGKKKNKIRKHRGIYQRGEKTGQLKPGFKYTQERNSRGQRVIEKKKILKQPAFTKVKNDKIVPRFAVNKFPTIPRKYQLALVDVFKDSSFEYIPVPIPTNNTGREINFDPATNKNKNIIKIGMSGNIKGKGKVSYKLFKLKKGTKILKKDPPSLQSENPYSKLIYLLEIDKTFKDNFKSLSNKKNINRKELKNVLSDAGIIADDVLPMETVVDNALRSIIEEYRMPISIIDDRDNKNGLYININGKRHKSTPGKNQILIVMSGPDKRQLQVTENSLKTMGKLNGTKIIGGEQFILFRDLYFTKSNKKSVWTFRF